MVCTNRVWGFKYPTETGVPSSIKREAARTMKLGSKSSASGSLHTHFPQLDSVVTCVQQLQDRIGEMHHQLLMLLD